MPTADMDTWIMVNLSQPIFDGQMKAFHHDAHAYFRQAVLSSEFACVGAQSSVKAGTYAFCAYESM